MIISLRTMASSAIRTTVRTCTIPCRRSETTSSERLNSSDREDHPEKCLKDRIVGRIETARKHDAGDELEHKVPDRQGHNYRNQAAQHKNDGMLELLIERQQSPSHTCRCELLFQFHRRLP